MGTDSMMVVTVGFTPSKLANTVSLGVLPTRAGYEAFTRSTPLVRGFRSQIWGSGLIFVVAVKLRSQSSGVS